MLTTILSVVFAALGIGAGYAARSFVGNRLQDTAEARAKALLEDAKVKERDLLHAAQQEKAKATDDARRIEQEALLDAREKAFGIIEDAKKVALAQEADVRAERERVIEREQKLDETLMSLEREKNDLASSKEEVTRLKEETLQARAREEEKLAQIAGLSREEALAKMEEKVKEEHGEAIFSRIRKMDEVSEEEIESKSRKILSVAIERYARSHVVDATTTYVELPNDDFKGRIIGKEGRNIKVLEHLTGCEFVIDDTPGMLTISGFSPVRRHVAKRALEALIKDGRIQPARVEDAIKTAKDELSKEMKKAGEDALFELGIPVPSIDPKLVAILGRLKYRTSYGQNVLEHSLEVARIAGLIGEELGMDPFPLKKGGLFHDIGKAVDHDMQGAHPQIGYNIMKKFGFPEELCYQSIAHHEDHPRTISGVIVKAADAISGARPGARRSNVQEYLERLQNLENVAVSFEGVEKAYAIQAGREVRVFVEPKTINDIQAYEMARDIAKRIESELTYPGEVRVTVIRETRVVDYAR